MLLLWRVLGRSLFNKRRLLKANPVYYLLTISRAATRYQRTNQQFLVIPIFSVKIQNPTVTLQVRVMDQFMSLMLHP
jgi:hypothetical protein